MSGKLPTDIFTLKFVKVNPKTDIDKNNIWKEEPNKAKVKTAEFPRSDTIDSVKESMKEAFNIYVEGIDTWIDENEKYFSSKYENSDLVLYRTAWNLVKENTEVEIDEGILKGIATGLTALGAGAAAGATSGGGLPGAVTGAVVSGVYNSKEIKDSFKDDDSESDDKSDDLSNKKSTDSIQSGKDQSSLTSEAVSYEREHKPMTDEAKNKWSKVLDSIPVDKNRLKKKSFDSLKKEIK